MLASGADPHSLCVVFAYLLMAALTAACAGHIVASDLNFSKCRQNQKQGSLNSSFHGSVHSFTSNVSRGYSSFQKGREYRVTAESSNVTPVSLTEVAAPTTGAVVNEEGASGGPKDSVPIELSKFLSNVWVRIRDSMRPGAVNVQATHMPYLLHTFELFHRKQIFSCESAFDDNVNSTCFILASQKRVEAPIWCLPSAPPQAVLLQAFQSFL